MSFRSGSVAMFAVSAIFLIVIAVPQRSDAYHSTLGGASVASADLFVSKIGPGNATVGSTVQFNVAVANLGPDSATAVSLNDVLPAGMTFVSESQVDGPSFTCINPP